MRIGLAGAGRMGSVHARNLGVLPSVRSLIIADPNADAARGLAAELDAEHVADPDALFDAKIDALVIAASTDAHAELLVRGAGVGIPVFCEKPVALDAAATRRVIERVSGAAAPVYVGFQRRFDAGYRAARDSVRSGELGWLHTIRACTLDPAPPPLAYLKASGGFFRDCSVHDFDAIRWVTGREVASVYALGAVRGEDIFREAGDVDTVSALLELTDGAFAQVSATRYNAHGYDVRLELLGSKRGLSVGLDDRLPLASAERGTTFPAGKPVSHFMERFAEAYAAELAAFVETVAGAKVEHPLCSLDDALEATIVAEACDLSRIEGRPVRVDELRA